MSERSPTLTDCGCEVTVYNDGSGIEMHYCPMHSAAPTLLAASIAALHELDGYAEAYHICEQLRDAIANALEHRT